MHFKTTIYQWSVFSSCCPSLGLFIWVRWGFAGGSEGKESVGNVGDSGSVPGFGRSPREGNGYLLQYSCLENSMDWEILWAMVHGVAKSQTWMNDWHFLLLPLGVVSADRNSIVEYGEGTAAVPIDLGMRVLSTFLFIQKEFDWLPGKLSMDPAIWRKMRDFLSKAWVGGLWSGLLRGHFHQKWSEDSRQEGKLLSKDVALAGA